MYVCVISLIRNWPKFSRKMTKYGFSMIHWVLGNIVKKIVTKKPSSLIVMILQYTKNLQFKFIVEYNDIRNFKILRLVL